MVSLKRDAARTFETLVPTHHTTVDHNPDRNMHQLLVPFLAVHLKTVH